MASGPDWAGKMASIFIYQHFKITPKRMNGCTARGSNPGPFDSKSDTLTTTPPPRHVC